MITFKEFIINSVNKSQQETECSCGEQNLDLMVCINEKWICNSCIERKLHKLEKQLQWRKLTFNK